jgi:hypothetical protein
VDQKFATQLSDKDSSNIWKPLRNNKAEFNAPAVDSDSDDEENRSNPLEGVKSRLSCKVKVRLVPLELKSGE